MRRRDAIRSKVDFVNARLFRAIRRIPNSKKISETLIEHRDVQVGRTNGGVSEAAGLILAILCVALSVLFFLSRLREYGQWPPAIYQSSEVYNLTSEKVVWDIHYGPSLGCKSDECYRLDETPSSYFRRQAVLPLREFPVQNWHQGEPIYYRATIKIPNSVMSRTDTNPLSLHTIVMFADSWDFYLNNTLIFQGSKETMLVSIPRSFIRPDGTISVAIRADVGNQPYQGISNKGALVIGPRSKLAPLAYFARDNATSLPLLYLLPKLAFCVVFSLLFMFIRRNQEIAWFLIFGLTSSLELFLRSDFSSTLGLSGETTTLLALMARNYSLVLLARFVYAFSGFICEALKKLCGPA